MPLLTPKAMLPANMGTMGGAAMRGGGVGALAGGAINAYRGWKNSDPNASTGSRLMSAGKGALTGAAVGGAVGAGVGGVGQGMYRFNTGMNNKANMSLMNKAFEGYQKTRGTPGAKQFAESGAFHLGDLTKRTAQTAANPYFWNMNKVSKVIETRLKKPQRGWYKDPDPTFHGVNEHFKSVEDVRKDAVKAACAKYALLNENGEPVEQLVKILSTDNFGYTKTGKPSAYKYNKPVIFGPKGPQGSGWTADRRYGSGSEPYGGV